MSYDSLPPTPTTQLASDIVEGDFVHMMSLVDYQMRVLIEDISFSQMGDLTDMIFFMTSMRWTYWMIVGCLAHYQSEIVHFLDMLEIFIVESSKEIQFIYVGASCLC